MSRIKPFRGYRPRREIAWKVASLPYDVLTSGEARKLAAGNEYSFLHVGKPEIDLDKSIGLYDDKVYAKGVENLRRFISEGFLEKEGKACFYVYQQKMGDHVQAGLVCLCSVREYEDGLIKKHEFTRKDKEDDRTRHVSEQNANSEPVFLAYRANAAIDEVIDRVRSTDPVYDFDSPDGIGHTVWVVPDDDDIAALESGFADVPALYVADGHHRTAAAVRTGRALRKKSATHTGEEPFEYFMAVVFPHDQLQIMAYNRVVKDLNGLTHEQFTDRLEEAFVILPAPTPKPGAPHEFGMYLGEEWSRLKARAGTFPADDPVKRLDASILQENLLNPILGISDPRTDERMDCVGGIRGVGELERRVDEGWAVAFSLYPTSIEQLMAVADAGKVMPPKSTWFEPKLRSGLVVRLIED